MMKPVNFGTMVAVELGALLVGKIHHHDVSTWPEKGHFTFGGSTILLLVKANVIEIDADIVEYSPEVVATEVRLGEGIGRRS